MKKETKLIEVRVRFTEANHVLRQAREDYFTEKASAILWGLGITTNDASHLRNTVIYLVKQGYYSPNISPCAVELMFLKRMWREHTRLYPSCSIPWNRFIHRFARAWGRKRRTKK